MKTVSLIWRKQLHKTSENQMPKFITAHNLICVGLLVGKCWFFWVELEEKKFPNKITLIITENCSFSFKKQLYANFGFQFDNLYLEVKRKNWNFHQMRCF